MKRLLAIMLAICLVFSLTACVSINVTKTETTEKSSSEETNPSSEEEYLSNLEEIKEEYGEDSDEYWYAVDDYLSYVWENDPERYDELEAEFYNSAETSSEQDDEEANAETEKDYEEKLEKIAAENGIDSKEYSDLMDDYLFFLESNDPDKLETVYDKYYDDLEQAKKDAIQAFEVPLTLANFSAYFTFENFPVFNSDGALTNIRYKLVPTAEHWSEICCEKDFSFRIVYDILGIPSYVSFSNGLFYVTNYNGNTVHHNQQMDTFTNVDVQTIINSAITKEIPVSNPTGTLAKANVGVSTRNGRYIGFDYYATITDVEGSIFLYTN